MADILRILYVDDEPCLLDIGKMFLEREGLFVVDTLPEAIQAFSHIRKNPYDAIISDYEMPEMNGIAFLKQLRTTGNTTPFIVFTGRGREEVVIEALNEGADFYLQKGGDLKSQFAELVNMIHHAIARRQDEQTLKNRERDYRLLIESANEGIVVVQDDMLQMINPQLSKITGYSSQELISQPFTLIIHPDDHTIVVDLNDQKRRNNPGQMRYTVRLIRKDTALRWAELYVVGFFWKEQPAILVFMTDITEQKQVGDALRESEERYRQFFKTTLDCVFITTLEGQWIDFNDALIEMSGYRNREELFQSPVSSIYVFPEERNSFLARVIQEGYIKEHPIKLKKRDGTPIDTLLTVVPQFNSDGSLKAFIGSFKDITEHKRAEQLLRESEQKFRSLVQYALEGILILDLQGTILFLNNAAAQTFEVDDSPSCIGRNVMEFIAPESQEDVRNDFILVSQGHDAFLAQYHIISDKGNRFSVESIGKVITYEGKPADLISIRNITHLSISEQK